MSFGLMFIAVNLLYLLFSVTIGVIVLLILEKKSKWTLTKRLFISSGVFLFVLILPFYDLLIQKGIKTYYETFVTLEKIYAYPERDKDGKIESLGVWRRSEEQHTSNYLWDQNSLLEFKKRLSGISEFVEYYFLGSFEKTIDKDGKVTIKDNYGRNGDLGYARVYLNETPIRYEKIKNESKYQARYQVKGIDDSGIFYSKTIIEYWDMKENKLLATKLHISFRTKNDNNKFRNKYLLWRGPSSVAFVIGGLIGGIDLNYKLFKIIL